MLSCPTMDRQLPSETTPHPEVCQDDCDHDNVFYLVSGKCILNRFFPLGRQRPVGFPGPR